MGVYLNPGATMLRMGRRSKIYVDKSDLLVYLNSVLGTEQRYVCVARPRRFGKSMAANMVCAYYDRTVDGAEEFEGLSIADRACFDENRNLFDVVSVNIQQLLSGADGIRDLIDRLTQNVVWDLCKAYPEVHLRNASDLRLSMADVFAHTGRQFVIVIDEWDCVFREAASKHDEQEQYLDYLRAWLKDQPFIALCYMTGILPIKKYGTHSALNMFSEFSMAEPRQMASFMGFTEDEVRELCERWGRDFTECKSWYDGYKLASPDGVATPIYSPRSVVEAVTSGVFLSYWNQTETYEALKLYIDLDMDGLRQKIVELVCGGSVEVDMATSSNDMTTFTCADDVLTLLVHLGYLGYDSHAGKVFVPNREVMGEFAASTRGGGWAEVARSIAMSETLIDRLLACDGDAVAQGVQQAHMDASSIISCSNENSLACTLRLAFFSAIRRWRIVREAPGGKGFADLVLTPLASCPNTPGVVIELKYGETPASAIGQIRERGYAVSLEGAVGPAGVLLCGISYDPRTKNHSCLIERA